MKKILKYTAFAAMVGLFSSCSDSFFEAESGDIITSDPVSYTHLELTCSIPVRCYSVHKIPEILRLIFFNFLNISKLPKIVCTLDYKRR